MSNKTKLPKPPENLCYYICTDCKFITTTINTDTLYCWGCGKALDMSDFTPVSFSYK